MKYFSTKNKITSYSLEEAVLLSLPPDNGLFMPEKIRQLRPEFLLNLKNENVASIGYEIAKTLLGDDIPDDILKKICDEAFNFPVNVVNVQKDTYVCELFHGPTLAFKDFGARFMSRIMSYLNRKHTTPLTILVATSGDTGGAVADGFYNVDGIEVYILYPSGGVSELQEKQLTTYGKNIHAIEVKGTFDDCQRLVKQAFLDPELNEVYRLASANSINIARLIPQTVYYFEAFRKLPSKENVVFVVPSGNFGNLTAGLIARKMGLPVEHFVAATNINDVVPQYLSKGEFTPRASAPTISNAMDVGNPSNFPRMIELFGNSWTDIKSAINGYSFTDDQTKAVMNDVFEKTGYILDPHGAVAYLGWLEYQKENPDSIGVILETAHPAKFSDSVEKALKLKIEIPEALEKLRNKTKVAHLMQADYGEFKKYLLLKKSEPGF
ncbi:MAG: threonine synthase [Bacteroidetes bacterium]|nr:threonine synthase [Bacteroidota bacterium]MBK9413317.1 threonine synthase [Bacteroidota bacterium]MBL0033646.1 threonine synthase [Bacteroidota bacterium]MBP6427458.1 threonine synthase [Bacteroidia bacterium]